jgi:hypothetical protein
MKAPPQRCGGVFFSPFGACVFSINAYLISRDTMGAVRGMTWRDHIKLFSIESAKS